MVKKLSKKLEKNYKILTEDVDTKDVYKFIYIQDVYGNKVLSRMVTDLDEYSVVVLESDYKKMSAWNMTKSASSYVDKKSRGASFIDKFGNIE